MILTLTDEEAAVLNELLNIATKAGGLNVAEAALVLSKKLAAAVEQAKSEEDVDD